MVRRDRSRKSLKRPGPKREPYDRVLIVCEGEKTEPNYLKEMIAHFQLSSANVAIVHDSTHASFCRCGAKVEADSGACSLYEG